MNCLPNKTLKLMLMIWQDKKAIASNIESQARNAQILYIWTDCDREGENIGTEIRDIALKVNPRLRVCRARFSNIERAQVSGPPLLCSLLTTPQTCYTCFSKPYTT